MDQSTPAIIRPTLPVSPSKTEFDAFIVKRTDIINRMRQTTTPEEVDKLNQELHAAISEYQQAILNKRQ